MSSCVAFRAVPGRTAGKAPCNVLAPTIGPELPSDFDRRFPGRTAGCLGSI